MIKKARAHDLCAYVTQLFHVIQYQREVYFLCFIVIKIYMYLLMYLFSISVFWYKRIIFGRLSSEPETIHI